MELMLKNFFPKIMTKGTKSKVLLVIHGSIDIDTAQNFANVLTC